MDAFSKLEILSKSKKKKPTKRGGALKLLKRNAVPKNKGGRKNAPAKGGGPRAALMRKIHKDPDIQKLLDKNPKYDIIVVKKVKASVFAQAMVKASEMEGAEFDKAGWWEIAQTVNPKYTQETFERDWNDFHRVKEARNAAKEKMAGTRRLG